MKIVINKRFGGFCLSAFGFEKLMERKDKKTFFYKQTKFPFEDGTNEYKKIAVDSEDANGIFVSFCTEDLGDTILDYPKCICDFEKYRADTDLIAIIEEYGSEKISSSYSCLFIEEIPQGTAYRISEYDGFESIEYRDEIEWEVAT